MGDRTDEAQRARRVPAWRALLLVAGSALLGVIYFRYLVAEPYPSDIIRLVPFAWLVGSAIGCIEAGRALSVPGNRAVAGIALVLGIASGFVACIFAMGALVGD